MSEYDACNSAYYDQMKTHIDIPRWENWESFRAFMSEYYMEILQPNADIEMRMNVFELIVRRINVFRMRDSVLESQFKSGRYIKKEAVLRYLQDHPKVKAKYNEILVKERGIEASKIAIEKVRDLCEAWVTRVLEQRFYEWIPLWTEKKK